MKEFLKNKVQVIIMSVFVVIILTLSIVGGITISNLNNQINDLNNQLENMNKVDEDLDSYIDNLEAELNAIKTNLNSTNTKIDELEVAFGTNLDEAEESILEELNTVKTNLETELEEMSTLIDGLTSKDNDLEERITNLETSVDNLNTTLEALTEQVEKNAEDIKTLEEIIAGLEIRVNCLEGNHEMNITYTWSDDYSEVTAEGYCVHCEKEFTETVATIYLNGLVSADFSIEYFEDQLMASVASSQELLNAIDSAEIISTTENPATIKLMNDIEIEAIGSGHGIVEYAILIENGTIIIDLNGYELSASNNPNCVIQIGSEFEELSDATLIINDSSINKTGKIFALYVGIKNQGGKVIINDGTIEVNNTKGDWAAFGINQYLGSVTMNGGSILVTSVSDSWAASGINEDGRGGTFIMNDGYINVNSPFSNALYLRGTGYINGGTIKCNGGHVYSDATIYLGTNEDGIGATFIDGIKSSFTLNSLLTEGVGYYDANGNLIEVSDDVKEILDKGDITVKRIN